MNPPAQRQGAWILVSHSHSDLKNVRPICNELERRGHCPVLFFLKCLEDEGRPARTHPRPKHLRASARKTRFVTLPANWKPVRVFISSTFPPSMKLRWTSRDMPFDLAQDMPAERDHLVKVVFPTLREQLMPYHVTVVVINE